MSYPLIILDLGDNYILTTKNVSYNDAIYLYKHMEISINEITTNIFMNQDIMEFVYELIGHVISYGFSDNDANILIDIPEKLKKDIQKIIEFYKIKSFWENMQFPAKPKIRYNEDLYSNRTTEKYALIDSDALKIMTPLSNTESKVFRDIYNGNINSDNRCMYIIYNNIYNISLVVDSNDLQSSIYEIQKLFPEFCLVLKIDSLDQRLVSLFFHKKSFDKIEDIHEKYKAFNNLYNITKDNTEKQRVKDLFDKSYIVSNNIDKRMKANDLYKEVINYMGISYEDSALFKKRLAGYLLDFNLQKKRYSDGYFYYGIEKKMTRISLEEIKEKRRKELVL